MLASCPKPALIGGVLQWLNGESGYIAQLVRESPGKRLAVVTGGKVVAAPPIRPPLGGGRISISGDFSRQEAGAIIDRLNAYRKDAGEFLVSLDEGSGTPQDVVPPGGSFAGPGHEVVSVVRRFLAAIEAREYDVAIGLGVAGEFKREGLVQFKQVFELDQARVLEAYAGIGQAAVLTNTIPARAPARTGRFGYSLQRNGDSWLIRDSDFLPDEEAVQRWLSSFRDAEANAERITVSE